MPSDPLRPLDGTTLQMTHDRAPVAYESPVAFTAVVTRPAITIEAAYQRLADAIPRHKIHLVLKPAGTWRVLAWPKGEDADDVLLAYKCPTAFAALRAAASFAIADDLGNASALQSLVNDLEGL